MKLLTQLIIPFVIAGFLGGCVSTSSASYRSRGSNAAAWQVQGSWNQASGKVSITIDGTEVIAGQPGMFSNSKTLTGTYKKRPVTAMLTRSTNFLGTAKMHCIVTIDGEVAANFDW